MQNSVIYCEEFFSSHKINKYYEASRKHQAQDFQRPCLWFYFDKQ